MPWTEDEYLALGETTSLVELVDGGLWVNPSPGNVIHQGVSYRIQCALSPAAGAAGLDTWGRINVRLMAGSIVNPDIAVATHSGYDNLVTDAADLAMIGEITTPRSAVTDRWLKPHLYAAARIEWYLLVEPDESDTHAVALYLYRLKGHHYVEHAVAHQGDTLTCDAPFPFEINTNSLVPRADGRFA
jgi:hypothetical protein